MSYKNEAGLPEGDRVHSLRLAVKREVKTKFSSCADSQSGNPPGVQSGNTPIKPHWGLLTPGAGVSSFVRASVSDREWEVATKWEQVK